MNLVSRYLGSLLLSLALISPLVGTGCSGHVYYRAYDPYHQDYHRWDASEEGYYQQWERDNHRQDRDYRKLDKDDQKQYWDWRHSHDDHDHDHDHH